jgi:hypothetical protein
VREHARVGGYYDLRLDGSDSKQIGALDTGLAARNSHQLEVTPPVHAAQVRVRVPRFELDTGPVVA